MHHSGEMRRENETSCLGSLTFKPERSLRAALRPWQDRPFAAAGSASTRCNEPEVVPCR
jgi:hypothetical protein